MRKIIGVSLALLMPTLVQAQPGADACLVDGASGRISGKVEFVSYEHPGNSSTISGYKLILLRPRCFKSISLESDEEVTGQITEVALQYGGRIDVERSDFLKRNVGKTIAVTGSMFGHTTIYYVTHPAIFVQSMVPCTIKPRSKSIEKC